MFNCKWLTPILCKFFPAALVLGSLSFVASTGVAHETDNFYLPLDVEFADVGDFLGMMHTCAIEEAVAEVNAKAEQANTIRDPAARARRLEECHHSETIASAVRSQFGAPITQSVRAERILRSPWAARAYPGKTVSLAGIRMNFSGHSVLDPRALFMVSQSDTVKAFGVYFGTDKLTHFHTLGWAYYKLYQSELRRGLSREQAFRQALHTYGETSFLSEKNIYGTVGTGVYSNADMCVNQLGFRFYKNLTETVVLKGQVQQPLLVRTGNFWRVNHHVRPQSGWFGAYVSEHWNEALNPSLYDPTMRSRIRKVLISRADHIVKFYTQRDGRPNNPAYFEDLARKLSTYYSESYGHSGQFEKLMNIGNTCYPALRESGAAASSKAGPAAAKTNGRGAPVR